VRVKGLDRGLAWLAWTGSVGFVCIGIYIEFY
jgi:hypothetical protein